MAVLNPFLGKSTVISRLLRSPCVCVCVCVCVCSVMWWCVCVCVGLSRSPETKPKELAGCLDIDASVKGAR